MNIKLACMNLMWGGNLPNEKMPGWIEDVTTAGYEGVATFESDLLRFTEETDFVKRIEDYGLGLASVDLRIDDDFDRVKRVCEVMQRLGAKHLVTLGGVAKKGANKRDTQAGLRWNRMVLWMAKHHLNVQRQVGILS